MGTFPWAAFPRFLSKHWPLTGSLISIRLFILTKSHNGGTITTLIYREGDGGTERFRDWSQDTQLINGGAEIAPCPCQRKAWEERRREETTHSAGG